jgi:hypothetical protein
VLYTQNVSQIIYYHDFFSILFSNITPLPADPAGRMASYHATEEFCAVYDKWVQNNAHYPCLQSIRPSAAATSPSTTQLSTMSEEGAPAASAKHGMLNYTLSSAIANIVSPLQLFTKNPIYVHINLKLPVTTQQAQQEPSGPLGEPLVELALSALSTQISGPLFASDIKSPAPVSNIPVLVSTMAISNTLLNETGQMEQMVNDTTRTTVLYTQNVSQIIYSLQKRQDSKQGGSLHSLMGGMF